LLVLLFEECSLELPLGEPVFELEDEDECSVVVGGATTTGAGATTIGAGATITGAGYTATAAGAVLAVVVWLEVVVSVVSAKPTATLPNSTAIPKDSAAVFNECLTMISPLVLVMRGSLSD